MGVETIDIKNSCEYRWRMHYFKMMLLFMGIGMFVTFVVTAMGALSIKSEHSGTILLMVTGIISVLYLAIFLPFALYFRSKAKYLEKNYKSFSVHQVCLDKIKTSYWYRYHNYYTVTITVDGMEKQVDTNPLFCGLFFSPLKPDDYNNQMVWVLYDQRANKVYVVEK